MKKLRLVVLGKVASVPFAGMAWMHMHIAAGLQRLGHEVYYFETTSEWPYDPVRQTVVEDSNYAVPYLERVANSFGLNNCWAYRRSYSDGQWLGLSRNRAEELLAHADAVLNISGSTDARHEGLKIGRLVLYGTDPVYDEIAYAQGDPHTRKLVDSHDDVITYGENIGSADCPLPPLPKLRGHTRQPVLLDLWESGPPSRPEFTTVSNWKVEGYDIEFNGETYYWSKHLEYLKFIDLPHRVKTPIELAMGLSHLKPDERALLDTKGWKLADAHAFTTDPWPYREYVRRSRGEFSVAKDQNVRLRSGWFSERSACYLAAGRPVITQDTAFGCALPTGCGLFAYNTLDEAVAAFEAVESDYARQSKVALEIAREYFAAEKVMAGVLRDLGLA